MNEKLLKRLLLLAVLVGIALLALIVVHEAQAQTLPGQAVATQFGKWRVSGPGPEQGHPYQFPAAVCVITAGRQGYTSPIFSTNAPITIVDPDSSQTEVVTPSSVSYTAQGCNVSITPAHQHSSFSIVSGTCGLQEAINAQQGQPSVVIITSDFNAMGCSTATITAAQGNTNVGIIDQRTSVYTSYLWNGSNYIAQPTLGPTAPTSGTGAPVIACAPTNYGQIYTNTANGDIYACGSTGWVIKTGGQIPPSLPNNSVQICSTGGGGSCVASASDANITIDTSGHNMLIAPNSGGGFRGPFIGGVGYAKSFGDTTTNGILNCFNNNSTCIADPTYAITEQYTPATLPCDFCNFQDQRQQRGTNFYHNWFDTPLFGDPRSAANEQAFLVDENPSVQPAAQSRSKYGYSFTFTHTAPGWSVGNPPGAPKGGWEVPIALAFNSLFRGESLSETIAITATKYSGGDDAGIYAYTYGRGGCYAPSDECQKTIGAGTTELAVPYLGTVVATGTLTAPALIKTTIGANGNISGDGLPIIDTSNTPLSGHFTNISNTGCTANSCSNVTFDFSIPVSNMVATLAGECAPNPIPTVAPFTQSINCNMVVSSGTPVVGVPASLTGLVCLTGNFFEMSYPTAVTFVSGSTWMITLPIHRPHQTGSTVEQGGICGKAFEPVNYTGIGKPGLRYLEYGVGSTSSSVGQVVSLSSVGTGSIKQSPFDYQFINLASISNSTSPTSTVNFTYVAAGSTLPTPTQRNKGSFLIAGASDGALNGTCTNTIWLNATQGQCTITGLTGVHTAATATASLNTNNVKLWDFTDVWDVNVYSAPVTAWSIDGANNVTMTTTGIPTVNNYVKLSGFTTGAFFNGNKVKITATTSNSFTFVFVHGSASATEAGTATFLPAIQDGTLIVNGSNTMVVQPGDTIEQPNDQPAGFSALSGFVTGYNPYAIAEGLLLGINQGVSNGNASGSSNAAIKVNAGGGSQDPLFIGAGGSTNTPANILSWNGPWANGFAMPEGPAPNSAFLNGFSTAAQNADPNYLWNIDQILGLASNYQNNYNPHTGNVVVGSSNGAFNVLGTDVIFNGSLSKTTIKDNLIGTPLGVPTNGTPTKMIGGGGGPDATQECLVVYAGNTAGQGVASTETCATTDSSGTNANQILWNWSRVAGATSYKVCRGPSGAEGFIAQVNGVNVTSYLDALTITPGAACTQTDSSLPLLGPFSGLLLQGQTSKLNVTIKANTSSAAYPINLPAAQGGASTTILNDGAGNLTWIAIPTSPTKITNSITPAAATASSCVEQTFTYTPLATTQGVSVSPASSLGAHIWIGSTRVSAANTLAISFCADATAGTPPSGNYIATAF